MAKVPTYDSPQVDERALPGVRQESVASPALLGAAADSQIKLGGAIASAGTGLEAVALHMQEKENLRAVQDATAEYGARVLDWQTDAKTKRTGVAAQGVVTDFSEWHKKQLDEIGTRLGNDAQRQAFVNYARKTGLAARHDIATFEVGETRKANVTAADASAKINIDQGAVALTPDSANAFKAQLINSTRAFAASQNLPSEVEQELLTRRLTEFHAQRIQNLARTDPASATAYFEQNKGEIAGSQQAEIGKFAEKAGVEIAGVQTAGEIWKSIGPEQGLDQMEEAARKKYANEPEKLKATISNLRERTQAFDKGNQERVDKVAAAVNIAVIKGASPSQIRAMPEFITLTTMGGAGAKMAAGVIEHAENKQYSNILRATAAEARQQQVLARRGMGAYLQYSDPDMLAKMSREQVINLLPVLGNELTNHLMQRKDSLVKTEGKLVQARMDQDDFNHIAQSAGLKPFDPHKNEEEKAGLGELKFQIEQKIDAAQRSLGTGKELTRQQKMQIMQNEMDNKVLVDRPLWFDATKPAVLLKPDEMKNAYVTVEGKDIKLSTIPKEDRAAIITSRQKYGLPITEQAIAEAWVKKSATKKPAADRGGATGAY